METNRQDAKNAKRREPSQEIDKLAYTVIRTAIEVWHGTGDWVKSLFVSRFYHLLMS